MVGLDVNANVMAVDNYTKRPRQSAVFFIFNSCLFLTTTGSGQN